MVATEALVYWSMRFGGSVASADGGSKLKALQIPESLALEINSNGNNFIFQKLKRIVYELWMTTFRGWRGCRSSEPVCSHIIRIRYYKSHSPRHGGWARGTDWSSRSWGCPGTSRDKVHHHKYQTLDDRQLGHGEEQRCHPFRTQAGILGRRFVRNKSFIVSEVN